MKKTNLIIGIILLIIGGFYSLLPHTLHISSGFAFGLSHTVHITIGIIAIILAAIVLYVGKGR